MKKVTVREYDKEGLLVKETITEEDTTINPVITYPVFPVLPIQYPPWNEGTITITCDSLQKG